MTDEKKATAIKAITEPVETERQELLKSITQLERQNKSLLGLMANSSPQVLAELKAKNDELKAVLIQVEKDLAALLISTKVPSDTTGMADKFQMLKMTVLSYCSERKLDPQLWKKLESL